MWALSGVVGALAANPDCQAQPILTRPQTMRSLPRLFREPLAFGQARLPTQDALSPGARLQDASPVVHSVLKVSPEFLLIQLAFVCTFAVGRFVASLVMVPFLPPLSPNLM